MKHVVPTIHLYRSFPVTICGRRSPAFATPDAEAFRQPAHSFKSRWPGMARCRSCLTRHETVHAENGNCWKVARHCPSCGKGNICDVCHHHEQPRGQCDECADCSCCANSD